jgi:hypothetical protein
MVELDSAKWPDHKQDYQYSAQHAICATAAIAAVTVVTSPATKHQHQHDNKIKVF